MVATGHAMLGITLAPATGRLVADLVSERPVPWYSVHLRPERFRLTRRRATASAGRGDVLLKGPGARGCSSGHGSNRFGRTKSTS